MTKLTVCRRGHSFDKNKYTTCPKCWPGRYRQKNSDHDLIDRYIDHFPGDVKKKLKEIRQIIHDCAPDADETVSYGIPTFDLCGKHLVHFAGFKHHVGFYPTSSGIAAFKKEITRYKSARGSVQFPLDQPIPVKLIKKMVLFRVKEITG